MNFSSNIKNKIKILPQKPGVYLMKNIDNEIIYVGKAKNLKNRVTSYFHSVNDKTLKKSILVSNIDDFELIITNNELEALILECNLIKKYKPKYNVLLKDDKTYPYLKLTLNEEFPRLVTTRKIIKDKGKYFGPYTNIKDLKVTLHMLRKIFPLRTCKTMDKRACLNFHIKRCAGPCIHEISKEDYMAMVRYVELFLKGNTKILEEKLEIKMVESSKKMEFEKAAFYRDQIVSIKKIAEKQIIYTSVESADVIGTFSIKDSICIQIFKIRFGKIMGRKSILEKLNLDDKGEVLNTILKQYYVEIDDYPKEIIMADKIHDEDLIADYILEKSNKKVHFKIPIKGIKKELLKMAEDNAKKYLEDTIILNENKKQVETDGIMELKKALNMAKIPYNIECFDISHNQGSETVASMVVFTNGKKNTKAYRKYKIKSTEGKPDDFKSMEEVVSRRYKIENKTTIPELIIIDGGKGQLSSASKIIRNLGHKDVTIVGLAKRFEYLFMENKKEPIILDENSPAMYLIKQIRDEAHRFAITFHRKLRQKRNKESILDNIKGIGPNKRKALYNEFKTLENIKNATVEDLSKIRGINENLAKEIKNFFNDMKNIF